LILRKIIKIVATRCHILKLKCTKCNFGWGCALRELTALPRSPYLDLRGPVLLRQGMGERIAGKGKAGEEEGRRKRERRNFVQL